MFKRRLPLISIVVVALLVVFGVYWIFFHKNKSNLTQVDQAPTTQQYLAIDSSDVTKNLKTKDYGSAVNAMMLAEHDAVGLGDYTKAKDILQSGISQIPDQYVTWDVYSSLANVAGKLKDTALEKSSLQKAIQKASATDSGALPEQLTSLQKTLAGLK